MKSRRVWESEKNYVVPAGHRPGPLETMQKQINDLSAERQKTFEFLENILSLDPSLDRFRHDVPSIWDRGGKMRVWDFTGVAEAIAFRTTEAVANKYAPAPEAPAPKNEAGKK